MTRIYDEDETTELFGKDFLAEWGTRIDPELIQRYKAAYKAFWDIQDEIWKITKQ
jgi:hypothetical protein